LYYVGLDRPGLAATLDLDTGGTCLYGEDPDLEEVVWSGDLPSIEASAERSGLSSAKARRALADDVQEAIEAGRRLHFLPPYRAGQKLCLQQLLGILPSRQPTHASRALVRSVIRHRSRKSPEEIDQIEAALDVTARMHRRGFRMAAAGTPERDIAAALHHVAATHGTRLAYRATCSIDGEVLHNHVYENTLADGDLLLLDAGAASRASYASDVSRVAPVGGRFSTRQRDLYQAVLDTQTAAIDAMRPGRPFRDVHRRACLVLTERLIDLGLMTGPPQPAVEAGAHALFFPHGLGHMLGLDVHDMENLGEDLVGYAPHQERSEQFGLASLRLARPLEPGFVVTVEPGCYLIPRLVNHWAKAEKHADYINYAAVRDFLDVGGIRIEDDVLVTEDGTRVLGPDLPKAVDDVEAITASGATP